VKVAPLVIVSAPLANKPFNAGEAWEKLSWVSGLKKLGCRIHFLEVISPDACVDEAGNHTSFERSVNRQFFRESLLRLGLAAEGTLLSATSGATSFLTEGATWDQINDKAKSAQLLVNISGHLKLPALLDRIKTKAYIDVDPGFTQFWHADPSLAFRVDRHDHYFTIGENIGSGDCPIPTGGIEWKPIRQPVVLADWPDTPAVHPSRFTTIARWRAAFGPVEFGGRKYGLKVHEFRKVAALPQQVASRSVDEARPIFEVALDIDPTDAADRAMLESNGWIISDPRAAVPTLDAFQRFVQDSGAEFSVAQGVYVDTQSGWFSDRTVRYLASGRAALVQDTGFGKQIPTGEGVLAFRTLDDAVAGAEEICGNYAKHSRYAREIAVEYFDSDRVLRSLLQTTGIELPR
jgi:hypothetical protein